MENETVIPSLENTPAVGQPAVTSPSKSNALLPIVLTLVISGVVFGVGGFYLGSQSNRALAPENPSPAPLMAEQDPSTPPLQTAASLISDGTAYMVMKFSKEGNTITPADVQAKWKQVIETIQW